MKSRVISIALKSFSDVIIKRTFEGIAKTPHVISMLFPTGTYELTGYTHIFET
jgi:hypothetical protein